MQENQPQISNCDRWLQGFYGRIPFEDYILLDRSARTLLSNILKASGDKPLPWSPWRGVTPSHVGFRGIWNWDTAFHAIGISHWDPELAREQIRMFLSLQKPSGLLPDVLFENGKLVDTFGKPPVMPWAAMVVNQRNPDLNFVQNIYEPFVRYLEFWVQERGGQRDGLFHYDASDDDPQLRLRNAKFESGWDNAVRWDQGLYELWAIDLNCFMLMSYRAMAYFAQELERDGDAEVWNKRASALQERIESTLWDEERGMYLDYDFKKNMFIDAPSPASFMPLYVKTASPERAQKMAHLAGDSKGFYPGWPTVAYGHPEFDPEGYWRGRTWLNVAYFALKGLAQYGVDEIAEHGRQTLLGWIRQEPAAIHENYNPLNGQPLGAPHFSWSSVFTIEFLLGWS